MRHFPYHPKPTWTQKRSLPHSQVDVDRSVLDALLEAQKEAEEEAEAAAAAEAKQAEAPR